MKAREQGKVRCLGFSAHTTVAALDVMNGFQFDTVMFPINFVDYFVNGFGKEVIQLANKQGAGLISIKIMSHGRWPQDSKRTRDYWYRSAETDDEIARVFRWTLSMKGLVAGIPPAWLDLNDKAIEAAKRYKPATADDAADLERLAASLLPLFRQEESRADLGSPDHPYWDYRSHEV